MENTVVNSLERIENPILLILIAVLLIAVMALWWQLQRANGRLYDLAVETVGALKDVTNRFEQIETDIQSLINQNNGKN